MDRMLVQGGPIDLTNPLEFDAHLIASASSTLPLSLSIRIYILISICYVIKKKKGVGWGLVGVAQLREL